MRRNYRFIYQQQKKCWTCEDMDSCDWGWWPNVTIVTRFVVSYRKLVSLGISPVGIPKGVKLFAVKDMEQVDYFEDSVTEYYLFTTTAYKKLRCFYGEVKPLPSVEILYNKPHIV